MLKQTLFFTTPVHLSLKNMQLVIRPKDETEFTTRPIEDIGVIILENQMVSVTLPLLNELVRNNIAVVLCDERFMPSAMLMSLDANSTQAESYKLQMSVSEPVKKQLWRQIIMSKIKNQSLLLKKAGKDGGALIPVYQSVKSGDSDNREGVAAKFYWSALFGKDFIREREGISPNNLLNYGYSVLRAAVARALLGSGLSPMFGIFHRNRYNAFPLADDIMEPYRPFVDNVVYDLWRQGKVELDKEVKSRLLSMLFCDVKMGSVTRPLEVALTLTTASIVKYYDGEIKTVNLPVLQ